MTTRLTRRTILTTTTTTAAAAVVGVPLLLYAHACHRLLGRPASESGR